MKALRLAGHPLHPMLVHFPVALWTLAVAADAGGLLAGDAWWWRLGFGCQALGLATAALAMVAGWLDYASLARSHPAQDTAVAHLLVMSTAWLSFLASLGLRGLPDGGPPPWPAIAVAGFGFVAMAVGGDGSAAGWSMDSASASVSIPMPMLALAPVSVPVSVSASITVVHGM